MERIKDGKPVSESFIYDSETNTNWMSVEELGAWVKANKSKIRIDS